MINKTKDKQDPGYVLEKSSILLQKPFISETTTQALRSSWHKKKSTWKKITLTFSLVPTLQQLTALS